MAQSSHGRRTQRAVALRRRLYAANRRTQDSKQTRRRALGAPWFVAALVMSITGSGTLAVAFLLARNGQRSLTDTLVPVGIMVLALSLLPLVVGILRTFDAPQTRVDTCGRCQFYRASISTYQVGICAYSRDRRPTSRVESCEHFTYSERAMVRDRLTGEQQVINLPTES